LSEEATLKKQSIKDLNKKEQLERWLEINKKKNDQAKSFNKKYKKAEAKLKELKFSKVEKINKLINDACRRKSLYTTMQYMQIQKDDGSMIEHADKVQQLRKGMPTMKKNGEDAFNEAMELAKTLNEEEKKLLWENPDYQARNKNAKCFDDLITKTDAKSNDAIELLKASMVKLGLDVSMQSNVLEEMQKSQKKKRKVSLDKSDNALVETSSNETVTSQTSQTETASSVEPSKELPIETAVVSAEPVPQPTEQVASVEPIQTEINSI